MPDLSNKRCHHHRSREAVACCPGCGRFFCRECVTEHEVRLLCAGCLQKIQLSSQATARRVHRLICTGHFLAGTLLAWAVFFYFGGLLLSLPTEFHEGTIWQLIK